MLANFLRSSPNVQARKISFSQPSFHFIPSVRTINLNQLLLNSIFLHNSTFCHHVRCTKSICQWAPDQSVLGLGKRCRSYDEEGALLVERASIANYWCFSCRKLLSSVYVFEFFSPANSSPRRVAVPIPKLPHDLYHRDGRISILFSLLIPAPTSARPQAPNSANDNTRLLEELDSHCRCC